MTLSIVTGNSGKYEQISRELKGIIATQQIDLDIPEIQTNILADISRDKCMKARDAVQAPVLVDDTGIYFQAFHQFPGALTKFLVKGVGLAGIRNLFYGVDDRSAVFQCVLSYMDASLDEPLQFIGECPGTITFDRMDKGDADPRLPYDLIFQPDGMDKPAIFNLEKRDKEYNHRTKAARLFGEWIEKI